MIFQDQHRPGPFTVKKKLFESLRCHLRIWTSFNANCQFLCDSSCWIQRVMRLTGSAIRATRIIMFWISNSFNKFFLIQLDFTNELCFKTFEKKNYNNQKQQKTTKNGLFFNKANEAFSNYSGRLTFYFKINHWLLWKKGCSKTNRTTYVLTCGGQRALCCPPHI